MSDEVADAIVTLLNAGADPEALQDATQDIADVDFIMVEDLSRKSEALHYDAIVEALMDKCTELSKDGADIADLTSAMVGISEVLCPSLINLRRVQAEDAVSGIVH